MKTLLCGIGTMSLLLLAAHLVAQVYQKPMNSYLDQTPPGQTPVVFAPGVVSKHDVHSRLAISPDGKEMCWTSLSALSTEGVAKLLCIANLSGKWTSPHTPSFASAGDTTNPLFSPDGKRLIFNHKNGDSDWITQYVERTESGLSAPKSDGFLPKTSSSFTRSGKVYFSDSMTGKPWNSGIYSAQYSAGGSLNRQSLGAAINSPYIDYTPYISPDEAYLMFSSSRPSTNENMFLYISFKSKDNTWSVPVRMNDAMNFSGNARFPSISPDEKYVFFCGDDGNIYWVNISVIEKLRTK